MGEFVNILVSCWDPRAGICQECIGKAQRVADHWAVEHGMVRIGSAYSCTHCKERVQPVIWFDLKSTQEQFICARCLVEAQKQFLIEVEDLLEQQKALTLGRRDATMSA